MRRLFAAGVCGLILAAIAGAITACAGSQAEPSPTQDMIRRVNEFRAANGMPPLEVDDALMSAAQRHADWQAATHHNYHEGEGGSMPQDRAEAAGYRGWVSENVASGTIGFVSTEWAVDDGWANSPVHREAMLSQNVHVGAGVAENEEMVYYVLLVGSPSGEPAPAPTSTAPPVPAAPAVDNGAVIRAAAAAVLVLLGVIVLAARRLTRR